MSLGWRAALVVFGLAAAITAYELGDGYILRMSVPSGFELVTVTDAVPIPPPRPRRTVVVVADGLRKDAALGMAAVRRLAAAGQCWVMDSGNPTVSRPIYATLSTGLGQDRTGVRNNDTIFPCRAQSVWQLARAAGLRVLARSELPWFGELFPGAFERYDIIPPEEPYFAPEPLGDLTLIHPAYIDGAGHDHGGASPEYAAQVARLDREFLPFLDGLDLAADLVVFTADHGHTARGGHGGRGPEVARVLTCFAGRGVAHGPGGGMLARDLGPALTVLLGLPFPAEMRAGDDDLEVIWDLLEPRAFPRDYLEGRRAALARFRAANPSWPEVYDAGHVRQALRLGLVAGIIGAVLVLGARRRPVVLLHVAFVVAATLLLHLWLRGSLDTSSINKRGPYTKVATLLCLGPALVALAFYVRSLAGALAAQAVVVAVGLAVVVGHPFVFGWRLGFPLASPFFYFLPFLSAFFLLVHGALLALLGVVALARGRQAVRS